MHHFEESARGLALGRIAAGIRASRTRTELFATIARGVRDATGGAVATLVFARDPDGRSGLVPVAEAGDARGSAAALELARGSVSLALRRGELTGAGAAVFAPVLVGGSLEAVVALDGASPGAFDERDLLMLRAVASQLELALESRRLADLDALRGRRAASLERTMLALREPREPRDILAIVARGLAHDMRRPCVAYEQDDRGFVAVVGSGTAGSRPPVALDRFETELLASGSVRRMDASDTLGVIANDRLRALLVLEAATAPLTQDDERFLRAVATHAGLALSGAFALDQLRRYATEGAALREAARTILGFTELRPLAVALANLAARLVHARDAAIYAVAPEGLELLGASSAAIGPLEMPQAGDAPFTGASPSAEPRIVAPLALREDGRAGYLILRREAGRPFERFERRIVDALVALARLALRNVDLYERSDRANRALAESNGFKDDLLAMFAHDFRGPLTVISGFSELLLESSEDDDVRSSVRTISDQTKRLARLAEDALALAATQSAGFSLKRQLDDVGEFLAECCRVLDPEGRRLTLELDADLRVPFDRMRLRHVVDNVIGNALKYSSAPVDVRAGREPGLAWIEVTDRGIGIPAGELAAVFTRYGRASNARSRGVSGSGVGLYIAKKIVDVHGGTLTVTSVENAGSTFRITLPAD